MQTCMHVHTQRHITKEKKHIGITLRKKKSQMIKSFSKQKKKSWGNKREGEKASGSPGSEFAQQRVCWVLCLLLHLCCKTAEEKHFIAFGFFIFIFYVFEYVYVVYVCNAGRSQMWASEHLGLDLKTTVSPCGCWKLMFWEGIYIQTIACFLKSGTIKVWGGKRIHYKFCSVCWKLGFIDGSFFSRHTFLQNVTISFFKSLCSLGRPQILGTLGNFLYFSNAELTSEYHHTWPGNFLF